MNGDVQTLKWIGIDEQMPEKGQAVLVYDEQRGIVTEGAWAAWSGRIMLTFTDDCNVVAWAPMPGSPSNQLIGRVADFQRKLEKEKKDDS